MGHGPRDISWIITPLYGSVQELAYLDAALLTCSICELLNSLDSEVKLIWRGSRNATQICYILARYTCIASFVVFLLYDVHLSSVLSPDSPFGVVSRGDTYRENTIRNDWLLNINLLFVEIIFSLRTWALWERSQKMAIALGVLMVLLWGSNLGLLVAMLGEHLETLYASDAAWAYFISFAAFYLILLILVATKAHQARHELNISLIRLVHVQGLTYYILLFAMSLSAIAIAWTVNVNGLGLAMRLIQFVFTHMACRMSLSLRAQGSRPVIDLNSGVPRPSEQNTTIPLSDLNFRHSSGATYTSGTPCSPDRFKRLQPQGDLSLESSSSQAA